MHTRLSKVLIDLLVFSIVLPVFLTACGDDNPVAPVDKTISILFMSDRNGTDQVFGMNAGGSYQIPMVAAGAKYSDPVWSPDGTRFAVVRETGGDWCICVVNADGLTSTVIVDAKSELRTPLWSPDGSRLAFVVGADGNTEIAAINIDALTIAPITNHTGDDLAPAWHPDGSLISYASYNTGTAGWENRWIASDGSFTSAKIYATNCGGASGWSPDGTRYFRVRPYSGGDWAILTIENDGVIAGSLNTPAGIDCPAWLPDGSAVLVSAPRISPGPYEVMIWSSTPYIWSFLTDNTGNNTQPDCNEAMTRIVFCSDRDGNEEIYRMNFDGTKQANLTKNAARDWGPKWRPTP